MWPFRRPSTPRASNPAPSTSTTLGTDAPPHWPRPDALEPILPDSPAVGLLAPDTQNVLAVAAALSTGLGKSALRELSATSLVPGGVLEIPVRVHDGGTDFGVYVYSESTGAAAAHYREVSGAVAELGWQSVYYAPAPLPEAGDVAPDRPAGRADTLFLEPAGRETPPGKYAMWWSTDDQRFSESAAAHALDRVYRGLDRAGTYILARNAAAAGFIEPDVQVARLGLPGDLAVGAVLGPERRLLLLSASAEKGIRFHFHAETTPPAYRDRFLALYADYVEMWAAGSEERGMPPGEPEGEPLSAWWRLLRGGVRQTEARGESTDLGGILPV